MTGERPAPPIEIPLRTGLAFVFGAALLAYVYALTGRLGFVNYDDLELVSPANPAIADGVFGGLRALLDPSEGPRFMHAWLPLYYWSIGLDHAVLAASGGGVDHFTGAGAWIFHVHSVVLHGLGAVLVSLLGRRLGLTSVAATVAGVLFAVHPAAVESVAWVASRKDQLSFVWMAAAALVYLRGIETGKFGTHVLGAALLGVSMTAKGTTLVLPLLLVVHAWFLRDRKSKPLTRLLPVVPYAVVALLMTALHAWVASDEGTAFADGATASLGSVLLADLAVVGHYTIALAAPLRLSVEHGLTPGAVPPGLAVLGAVVVLVWAALLFTSWKKRPGLAAFLCALPLALAPFNNVFPRTTVLFAERYAYVAVLVVALGAGALLTRTVRGSRGLFPSVAVVGVMLCITLVRVPVWTDSISLWTDAVAKAPESPLARLQLAQAQTETYVHALVDVRLAQAKSDVMAFEASRNRALALDDEAHASWNSAASLAAQPLFRARARAGLAQHLLARDPLGERSDPAEVRARLERVVALLTEAEVDFRASIAAVPAGPRRMRAERGALVEPLGHRATARELLGDREAALGDWEAIAKIDPENAGAHAALGRVYRLLGRAQDAQAELVKSRELEPRDPAIVLDRVKVWLSMGDFGSAKGELTSALVDAEGRPLRRAEQIPLLLALGQLNRRVQRPLDAADRFREALAIRPGDREASENLGEALLDQAQALALRDDTDAAQAAAREAMELMPGKFAPYQILAIIARRAGNLAEATNQLDKALELFPKGRRIRQALQSIMIERAAAAFDTHSDGAAIDLMERAVVIGSDVISTPQRRLELAVSTWPEPPARASEELLLARVASLKGFALLAVGRPAEAEPELAAAADSISDEHAQLLRVTLGLLSRAQFEIGRPADAVTTAERLHALGPGTGEAPWRAEDRLASALVEHGIALRGARDKDGARKVFDAARERIETAAAKDMPPSRREVRRGEILFAEERFLEATSAFDRAVRLDARDVDAYLDLAAVWRTQFLLDEDPIYLDGAQEDLEKALKIAPGDARVLAGLGETMVMSGKQSEAFPLLMRAILADPSQQGARVLAARLMLQAGRKFLENRAFEEARDVATRAVALDPPHPDAFIFQADVLRAENEWERARVKYEEAQARFPRYDDPIVALAKFYSDLGHAYLLSGDRGRAVTAFKKALTYEAPGSELDDARERLVTIAKQSFGAAVEAHREERLEDAARAFRLSLGADPTPEGWFALGIVRGQQERFEDAVEAYTEALALRETYPGARLNRANAWLRLGRLDEGEADFRAWLEGAAADDDRRASVHADLEWIAKTRAEIDGRDEEK